MASGVQHIFYSGSQKEAPECGCEVHMDSFLIVVINRDYTLIPPD
jgi:hypothetical protein